MAADGLQDAERFGVETHGGTLESEQGTAVVGLLGMPQTVGQGDVLLDISQGRDVVVGTVQLIEFLGLFHAPLGIALLQIDCARTAYLRLVVGHELRRLLYGLVYLLIKAFEIYGLFTQIWNEYFQNTEFYEFSIYANLFQIFTLLSRSQSLAQSKGKGGGK